jgi:hypothetical protein
VKRLEPLHRRAYQSIFGPFELERAVYGSREGQTLEYVPLDAQLQLPASKFSYLLQEWDQALAVEQPFAQVSETVARILGFEQSVHSLERVNRQLSSSVEAFWDARAAAPAAQGEEIIVCSADGKGVVMRGELTETAPARAAPEAVLATPSKAGGKKMALIGAVYTIAPSVRTPSPVLTALFDPPTLPSPERPLRPKPLHKYVRASLERDGQDTMAPSYGCVFDWLEQEQRQRNPDGQRSVVVLLDGQDALWRAAERTFAGVEVVEILHLMHALEYLWDAAERLHPSAPKAVRLAFVKGQAERVLNGHTETVIRSLRAHGAQRPLDATQRKALDRICGYLSNNAHRMRYDQYLQAGYPIASGVIEGACRHVVVDRMERAGMRWVMSGAQAMLGLRCIALNKEWDELMAFHIARENQRLYPNKAANDEAFVQRRLAA